MLSHSWPKLAAACLALILCVAAVQAWLANRRDRAQLAAELATTKQLVSAADARQHDRDAQLAQTLADLASEKRAITTPLQIVRNLPNIIPLPAPFTLQSEHASSAGSALGSPAADASTGATFTAEAGARLASPSATASPSNQNQPGAIIPAADLKPLYDFALDCKACQARLAAAQADLSDEKSKTAALARERDDALRIARGGSILRRIRRTAKWFLIGAAAGAIAAKTVH